MRNKFYFDCVAIIIMTIMQGYNLRHQRGTNSKSRLFKLLIYASLICAITTVVDEVFIATGSKQIVLGYIDNMINSVALTLIAPVFVTYIIYATDLSHKLADYKIPPVALFVPSIVIVMYEIVSYVFLLMGNYTFGDSSAIAHRIYVLEFAEVLFYAIAASVFLHLFRKIINRGRHIIFAIPVVCVMGSMILRIFNPDINSVLFVVAMCFLFILLFNRNMEATLDVKTGFRTQTAFAETIKSAQLVNKKLKIIIADIINYNLLIQRVGFVDIEDSASNIAGMISNTMAIFGITGYEAFYNGNGCFYISLIEKEFDKCEDAARSIAKNVSRENNMGEVDYSLNVNVCTVSFPDDVSDVDSLIMLAEDLRKTPHSLHVLNVEELNSSKNFEIRRQMNKIIDRAFVNNYFSVYYQPIYNVKLDKFTSAEALIRLNDPVHGFISPGVFIPLAEKSGAIHKLGRFVIEEVCKFIASEEFKELGVEYIEVNLSVAQCHRSDLIDEIENITKKYGVSPAQLNLEITETAACYSENRLLNNIRSLHNLGYSFSLDDFGTGYSNLLRMASLPLNIVKLDRAFVLMDEDDMKFHVVIKNMVKLFRQMGLKILVEGVENSEMVEKFIDIDVDYIQGFYYSKPIPKDEYIAFLRRFYVMGSTGKII